MTAIPDEAEPEVYRLDEVAALFRVDPKTIGRWHRDGKFPEDAVFRTPGGHRRFRGPAIRAMLGGSR